MKKSLFLLLTVLMMLPGPAPAIQSRTGDVMGQVFYPDGKPASGIRVVAIDRNGLSTAASAILGAAQADASGRFHLDGLPPGNYLILAGPLDAGTYYPGAFSAATANTIAVTGGVTLNAIDFTVFRFVAIEGTVSIEGGGLMPDLGITFEPVSGGRAAATIKLSNDGFMVGAQEGGFRKFTMKAPEGEYRIDMARLPHGYSVQSIVSGNQNVLAKPLKLAPESPVSLAITLAVSSPKPWARVSGHVTGMQYLPAEWLRPRYWLPGSFRPSPSATQVQVLLFPDNMDDVELSFRSSASVAADGSFEFPMVPTGAYHAEFWPTTMGMTSIPIVVSNKDLTDMEIVIPAKREITGRVTVEGIGPLPRITMDLQPEEPTPTPTFDPMPGQFDNLLMQPDGTFKFALPEVELFVALNAALLPPGYRVKSFTYGKTNLLKDAVRFSGTETELHLILAAMPTSWLTMSGAAHGISRLSAQFAPILTGRPKQPATPTVILTIRGTTVEKAQLRN